MFIANLESEQLKEAGLNQRNKMDKEKINKTIDEYVIKMKEIENNFKDQEMIDAQREEQLNYESQIHDLGIVSNTLLLIHYSKYNPEKIQEIKDHLDRYRIKGFI